MARRKSLAWCALSKLRPLWQAPIQEKVEGRLFTMLVESILLYGGETSSLTTSLEKKLDSSLARLLRHALNKGWPDKTTNADLYQLAAVALGTAHEKAKGDRKDGMELSVWTPRAAQQHSLLVPWNTHWKDHTPTCHLRRMHPAGRGEM